MADLVRPVASSEAARPNTGIAILAAPPSGALFPARPKEASLDETSNVALLALLPSAVDGGAKLSIARDWGNRKAGAVEHTLYG